VIKLDIFWYYIFSIENEKLENLKSLHTSQVAHQAGAYPGFCSMKGLGIFHWNGMNWNISLALPESSVLPMNTTQ